MATKAAKTKNTTGKCQCYTHEEYVVVASDFPELTPAEAVHFQEYTVYETCGRDTANTFAPGHDAKLKSLLVHLLAAGEDYHYNIGGTGIAESPLNRARAFGWQTAVKESAAIVKARNARQAKANKAKEAARAKRTVEDQAREAARNQRRLEKASALATPPSKRALLAQLAKDVNAGRHANAPARTMTIVDPITPPEADCRVKIGRQIYDAVTLSEDVNEVTISYWGRDDQVRSTRVQRAQILPLD